MASERRVEALCPDCGVRLSDASANGETRCARCFERQLRALDADFLDNYARLGARSHIIVAEACLKSLVLSDNADRKLLAATVYEHFVAAATDLVGLYSALQQRRERPIMAAVLSFRLDDATARAFFNQLVQGGPHELLTAIGLPHPDQLPRESALLDRRETREVRAALWALLADLERLTGYEEVGRLALADATRQLRGAAGLIERTEWLGAPGAAPGQLAALALDAEGRQIQLNVLSTEEETLGVVVDGIETLTRLVRNLVFAFVSLNSPEAFQNGFAGGVRDGG
jgi:hypothetical protein